MEELDLTVKQSELLFEATEIFQQWYIKHWGDTAPSFGLLLELNHQKLIDIVSASDMDESDIDKKLLDIRNTYEDMLNDEVNLEL